MRYTLAALGLYAATAVLLLLFLFTPYAQGALIGLGVALAALLALTILDRPWGPAQWLALAFAILAAAFAAVAYNDAGPLSKGAAFALLLASLLMIPISYLARRPREADQAVPDLDDEFYVEQVKPRPHPSHTDRLLTRAGTRIYHRARCRTLKDAQPSSLVELNSVEEAEAFGLEACRICRP